MYPVQISFSLYAIPSTLFCIILLLQLKGFQFKEKKILNKIKHYMMLGVKILTIKEQ